MIVPLLITYSQGNLNSIVGNNPAEVIKSLSGIQTCRFYYSDPLKNHKKIRIAIDGKDWNVIVEFGRDNICFKNPFFRKTRQLKDRYEDNEIVRDCFVIFKGDHCDVLNTLLKCDYRNNFSHVADLVSECAKLTKPIVPVIAEEEKEIWTAYCDGLNALNRERTDFLTINYVGSVLQFNDSRQGEIPTIKLGVETKSVKEIPNRIKQMLDSKYPIGTVLINEDATELSVRFVNAEKIADDDYEEMTEYLASFGFSPSKEGVVNLLKVSITLNKSLGDTESQENSADMVKIHKDLAFRQERMALADSVFSDLKTIAYNYEFDPEKACVIRIAFPFQSAMQREEILSRIHTTFNGLGDEFELIIKNPRGVSLIDYRRSVQSVQRLEEEFKADFVGEDIKLVNGKTYNELFSKVTDPTNIIDPELRDHYSRFINECPIIGTCYKRTVDSVVVYLSEDFYNGERMRSRIYTGDMIFFPSVGTTTELKRQTEAIQRINKPGAKLDNGRVVQPPINLKLSRFLFNPIYANDVSEDIKAEIKLIRNNSLEPGLNDKQVEAVAKAVLAKDIAFIQGPPGTGKTTVISEIIWQIIQRNPNSTILLTSQTNLAVDNALERLKQKRAIRPLRVISDLRNDDDDAIYNANILDNWVDCPNDTNKGNIVEKWIDRIAERVGARKQFQEITTEWKNALIEKDFPIRKMFVDMYKSNVNLVAATCSICGSNLFRQIYAKMYKSEEVAFDVVIMDEASKATPLEMAVPLVLGKKIILIGDHKQLPPLLDENSIDTALSKIGRQDLASRIQDLKESQFKKLFLMAQKYKSSLVTTLDTQYRMHKDIMMTINQFYVDDLGHQGLQCGIEAVMNIPDYNVKGSRWHGLSNEPFLSPETHAIWVNVRGREERVSTSYKNTVEIQAVATVVNALVRSDGFADYINAQKNLEDKEIGIITFYSAQRRARKTLEEQGGLDRFYDYRIDVVDKFQGMERNIVIVSTVRSNKYNAIGFAKEIERINVAFSRARALLIVVGDKDLFSTKDSYCESISAMETIDIKQIEDMLSNDRS